MTAIIRRIPQGVVLKDGRVVVYQSVEGNDWEQWKARMFNQMVDQFGSPGFAPLEQYTLRSKKEKRCIECGAAGTVQQKSILIKCVSHYWMCDSCDDYWRHKG